MPGCDVTRILLLSLTAFLHLVVMRATRNLCLVSYQVSNLSRKRASSLIIPWKTPEKILIGHILIPESITVTIGIEYSGQVWVLCLTGGTPKLLRSSSPLEKGLITEKSEDKYWEGKNNSCSL